MSPYRESAPAPRDLLAECVEIVAKEKTRAVAFEKSMHPRWDPDPLMLLDTHYTGSGIALGLVARLVGIGAGDLEAVDLKTWGNAPERTHAEVLGVLDQAIAGVERKAG